MQDIQDLKGKIFSESKNIIGILYQTDSAEALLARMDLINELAGRVSLLRLMENNLQYFGNENDPRLSGSPEDETTEEEAVFNNELNGIDAQGNDLSVNPAMEEAIFNSQLHEIIEEKFHETWVSFAEEHPETGHADASGSKEDLSDTGSKEDDHAADSLHTTAAFSTTEEEALFNNQLNEINGFENEISDHGDDSFIDFEEEERIQERFESSSKAEMQIPGVLPAADDTFTDGSVKTNLRIEEKETDPSLSPNMEIGETANDARNADQTVQEIKQDHPTTEKTQGPVLAEINDRRLAAEAGQAVSDQHFEHQEDAMSDKKIKLSSIRGLKASQSLSGQEYPGPEWADKSKSGTPDTGSLLKNNVPTGFMEAEKRKPEFRLDLNDRIAFSKMLFGGSQSELNEVVDRLNTYQTLEEAKEYLSDLYYSNKWNKVDEYAQRLWVLVENKFL